MRYSPLLARPALRSALLPVLRPLLVAGAALGLAACGESFTSDDAGAGSCPAPSCEGAGSTCMAYDFTGDCPADWQLTGDFEQGAIGQCTDGKLLIAADDTLDVWAMLEFESPTVGYALHAAMRLSFEKWDGGPMLALGYDQQDLVRLDAEVNAQGNSVYTLGRDDLTDGTYECAGGEEHLFEFDLSEAGFTASVDCQPMGSLPAAELPTGTWLWLTMGKTDTWGLEARLDDVVISFR